MEPPNQQQQPSDHHNGKAVQSNYLCRQSSTRWTPTTDQIKILKDLYYKEGVRSPNADQIQKISAQLRQFGKIEGKNVFYWFQNHKARERQKKKFTSLNTNPTSIRYPNFPQGIACPSSSAAGMVSVGQMVGGCGYGHMSMESNYLKECGVAGYGNGGLYSYPSQSFQWSNGVNPYTLMEASRNPNQVQFLDDQDEEKAPELETLPLFPIHTEDSSLSSLNADGTSNMMRSTESDSNCYNNTCHWLNPQATLELSLNLNSYGDHQWPNY